MFRFFGGTQRIIASRARKFSSPDFDRDFRDEIDSRGGKISSRRANPRSNPSLTPHGETFKIFLSCATLSTRAQQAARSSIPKLLTNSIRNQRDTRRKTGFTGSPNRTSKSRPAFASFVPTKRNSPLQKDLPGLMTRTRIIIYNIAKGSSLEMHYI